MNKKAKRIAVLGAGFAGLSAAYHLKKNGFTNFQVFEASDKAGGLARSFDWHGISCDLAPHRLFSNDQGLLDEMKALVPCHSVGRNSQICLSGQWISDPVNAIELMTTLPPKKALGLVFSYVQAVIKRADTGDSFHSFVQARYGNGLNEIFFRPYAEKLFGIPATQISASWGESKVRVSGVKDMLRRNTKLYFDKFYYPDEGGYGAFVEKLYSEVKEHVKFEAKLIHLSLKDSLQMLQKGVNQKRYIGKFLLSDDSEEQQEFEAVINTIPIPRLAQSFGHTSTLRYRGARLVYLLVNKSQVMEQQWVYFVDQSYPINRLAEFKNFNPEGNHNSDKTVLCAEVTDHEKYNSEELVEAVVTQLVSLGMFNKSDVDTHKIIPIDHAYPVYDLNYTEEKVRLDQLFDAMPNIHFIGRQAQFMHQDIDEIYASAKHVVEQDLFK